MIRQNTEACPERSLRDRRQKTELWSQNNFILFSILFLCIFLSCKTILTSALRTPHSELIKEVYHKEVQYLKARVSNDLNTLYFFQHPEYKVIIDIDKFKSSGGEIQLDYSSITEQNPVPHVYIIPHQFPASVKDFRIEKCFIGKEGRYAKFNAIIVMNLFLPFVRGPVEREARNIEYWEKVNGEWFVLNKVRPNPSHISGAVTATPINLPEEKAEYIEVDTRLVTSDL